MPNSTIKVLVGCYFAAMLGVIAASLFAPAKTAPEPKRLCSPGSVIFPYDAGRQAACD